jgi:hypothetical protein
LQRILRAAVHGHAREHVFSAYRRRVPAIVAGSTRVAKNQQTQRQQNAEPAERAKDDHATNFPEPMPMVQSNTMDRSNSIDNTPRAGRIIL